MDERMGGEQPVTKHVQIDGNTRGGALFALGNKCYLGTRATARGKFEERRFEGLPEWQAKEQWRLWRDEPRSAKPTAKASATKEEGDRMPGKTPEKKQGKRSSMFVIAYTGRRGSKDVALFESEDSAFRMATALTAALEVSGTDGEYDVSELPIWE